MPRVACVMRAPHFTFDAFACLQQFFRLQISLDPNGTVQVVRSVIAFGFRFHEGGNTANRSHGVIDSPDGFLQMRKTVTEIGA